MDRAGLLVAIAGVTVPGKYLGGTPATLTEIQQVGHMVRGPKKLIGGPIGFGYAGEGGKKAIREQVTGFDALLTRRSGRGTRPVPGRGRACRGL